MTLEYIPLSAEIYQAVHFSAVTTQILIYCQTSAHILHSAMCAAQVPGFEAVRVELSNILVE